MNNSLPSLQNNADGTGGRSSVCFRQQESAPLSPGRTQRNPLRVNAITPDRWSASSSSMTTLGIGRVVPPATLTHHSRIGQSNLNCYPDSCTSWESLPGGEVRPASPLRGTHGSTGSLRRPPQRLLSERQCLTTSGNFDSTLSGSHRAAAEASFGHGAVGRKEYGERYDTERAGL